MNKFGYAKPYSGNVNLDIQIDQLYLFIREENFIFTDKKNSIENYNKLKTTAKPGDVIYIKSMFVLNTAIDQIVKELEYLRKNGILVRILDIPTTLDKYNNFGEKQGKILEILNKTIEEMMIIMGENEKFNIFKKQLLKSGNSKNESKNKGRPKIGYPANWNKIYSMWENKEISSKETMKLLNLKKTKFYDLVKEFKI
ncbi:MAG: hypothetical protein ACERKV_13735 [Clostridiaceae bacterium]